MASINNMTPSDLVDDLRSRINPVYAAQLGTESYERRLCAEALESLLAETAALRGFAHAVMEVWPMGDLDGGTLQEIAKKHGMLKPETRHEPCGEGCSCAEYADAQEWEGGVVCYRKTPLLKGPNAGSQRERNPWPAEPAVCRVAHGLANRVDRVTALGNGRS